MCSRNTVRVVWLDAGVPGGVQGDEIRGVGRFWSHRAPWVKGLWFWTRIYETLLENFDQQNDISWLTFKYGMNKSWEKKVQPREYCQRYYNSVVWWQLAATHVSTALHGEIESLCCMTETNVALVCQLYPNKRKKFKYPFSFCGKAREEAERPAGRLLQEFSRDLGKDGALMAVGRVGFAFYLGVRWLCWLIGYEGWGEEKNVRSCLDIGQWS